MLKITQDFLNDPSVHYEAKRIVKKALENDIIDAYYDIEAALRIIKEEKQAVVAWGFASALGKPINGGV